MKSYFEAFLEVNSVNSHRLQVLGKALAAVVDKSVEVVVLGTPGCTTDADLVNQYLKPASIVYVDDWAAYWPTDNTPRFIVFVEGTCGIREDALAEFLLAYESGAQIVYADTLISGPENDVFCKPGWSPELLLSTQYLGALIGMDKELFLKVNGFRAEAGLSQMYDLLLRASEGAEVGHVPLPLYTTFVKKEIDEDVVQSGKKTVQNALSCRKSQGQAEFSGLFQKDGAPIFRLDFPDDGPSVAIMIASRNNVSLLQNCLRSLEKTNYKNYTIVILDNESDNEEMLAFLQATHHTVLNIERPGGRFNFSYIYNQAAKLVDAEYMLLLNSDTEVITQNWISDMVGYAQLPGVGSVGARLLFANNAIQHAGICHNMHHGFPVTAFRHLPSHETGYWNLAVTACNHMAETAACLLTPRLLFLEVGGLDEECFGVAFNDCDYGYRLVERGLRNVFCPTAELYHFENATRGSGDNPAEEAAFIQKYKSLKDKYYNAHYLHGEEGSRLASRAIITARPSPLRLAMVMHDLTRTGACRNACFLARSLKERGAFNPMVIAHLDGPLRQELEEAGIPVTIMPHFHMLAAQTEKKLAEEKKCMAEWLARLRPDVIYGNTILTFWAMGAGADLGIPCVWNIRESETPFSHFDEHSPLTKAYAQECMSYPYQVVFVADATRALFASCLHHNGMTIHNGFDAESFLQGCLSTSRPHIRKNLGAEENDIVILTVGTLCERKGQKDVVESFIALAPEMLHQCRLYLVCGPVKTDYGKEVAAMIEACPQSVRERIHIINNPGNIDHCYLAADIFVCSSRIESFPRVIQEAMAVKLPIITTPVFGVTEQVRDGLSALFYQPGDCATCTSQLSRLISSSELRARLGNQAFLALGILPRLEDMIEAYEQVLQEAWLSGSPRNTKDKR